MVKLYKTMFKCLADSFYLVFFLLYLCGLGDLYLRILLAMV